MKQAIFFYCEFWTEWFVNLFLNFTILIMVNRALSLSCLRPHWCFPGSVRANLILIDKKVDVHSPKIKTKPTNPTNMPVVDISSLTQIQSNFSSKLRIFFIQNFFCGLLYVLIITTGGNVWLSFLRDMNS